MPYRRLPNTDKSRLIALEIAIETHKKNSKVLSFDTVRKISLHLTDISEAVKNYKETLSKQRQANKNFSDLLSKSKLYISHFYQVMQFAILRGDLPKNERKFFGLSNSSKKIPVIRTYKQVLNQAEIIIKGEQKRISEGKRPIQNPSYAEIDAIIERLKESYIDYENLKNKTKQVHKKLEDLRPIVDLFIKNLWDEIEDAFAQYPTIISRQKAKEFGVKYVYRKNEEKIELEDILMFNKQGFQDDING
jgi:hypothetical protein